MDQIDINKLWHDFLDTISKHYMDFDGRVGRAQYWYYIAVYVVLLIGVAIIGGIVSSGNGLVSLCELALFLPTLGITARRLHDTDRTASWVLILAVPAILGIILGIVSLASLFFFPLFFLLAGFGVLISLISLAAAAVLVYFCAQPGSIRPNEYGPVPAEWSPKGPPAAAATPPPATPPPAAS